MSAEKTIQKFQKELNAGAISLVLMSAIQKHGEPMYGYEICKELSTLSDGVLPMNQAAIYPVLRSLEKQKLLRSQMMPSKSGPPRKYYQLTKKGKQALLDWTEVWAKTTSFVNSILERNDETTSKSRGAVSGRSRTSAKAKSRRLS